MQRQLPADIRRQYFIDVRLIRRQRPVLDVDLAIDRGAGRRYLRADLQMAAALLIGAQFDGGRPGVRGGGDLLRVDGDVIDLHRLARRGVVIVGPVELAVAHGQLRQADGWAGTWFGRGHGGGRCVRCCRRNAFHGFGRRGRGRAYAQPVQHIFLIQRGPDFRRVDGQRIDVGIAVEQIDLFDFGLHAAAGHQWRVVVFGQAQIVQPDIAGEQNFSLFLDARKAQIEFGAELASSQLERQRHRRERHVAGQIELIQVQRERGFKAVGEGFAAAVQRQMRAVDGCRSVGLDESVDARRQIRYHRHAEIQGGDVDLLAGDLVVELDFAALQLQIGQQERCVAVGFRFRQNAVDDVGKIIAADAVGAGADQMHFRIEHQAFIQHGGAAQQRGGRGVDDQRLDGQGGGGLIGFEQGEIGNRQLQDEGIEMHRADFGFAAQLFLNLFNADFFDEMGQREPACESQYEQEDDDAGNPAAEFAQPGALRQSVGNPGLDGHHGRSWHALFLLIRYPEV